MAGAGSESEIVRRNTDCVYFLASPLTCKKGSECEYRHSDIARLNPRDCWYWFSGNCLNPTCAFRHPHAYYLIWGSFVFLPSYIDDSWAMKDHPRHHPARPRCSNNQLQPLQGLLSLLLFLQCILQERRPVPFLHTVDEISPAQKAPRAVSKETDDGPATADLPLKPTEEETMDNALQEISPLWSLWVNYVDQREGSFSDHSSDGLGEDHAEAEERWESSPGFDVLVDGRSEQLAYEDDAGLHGQIIHYDYEDSAAYDAINYRPYEGYDDFDDGYAADCAEGDEEQMLYRRKRSHGVEPQGAADLRDHLRKLRRVDFHHPMPLGPREGGSFYSAVSDSSEFPEKRGMALLCSDGLPSEPQLEERWRKAGGPRRGELTSADFEGPKPLSEILKDKRGHGRGSSVDEEEDDEVDEHEKKVAGILA
ncbi:unnamed protein product [Spirodela intermedia]|uniref:C3H1-type domain-containing protein n=1 Tax=Spirodela intermedia TaxID=51605 RepID=A0A7I8JNM8_SPIIN|nr:unnamed protein product [Spirodela intermedia]CAA6671749.1 unnamed protein product [Spirodela intermedia]